MSDRIDELLRRLPQPTVDRPLDQLEPQVWSRIERDRRGSAAVGTLRFQLAAAGIALCVGLALGWSMRSGGQPEDSTSALYASYAEAGPLARLGDGL